MHKNEKKHPVMLANFGTKIGDLTIHGGWAYLQTGVHKCHRCLLKDDCKVYGTQINGKVIGPDSSCIYLEKHSQDIVEGIMSMDHINPQDAVLVSQLARASCFLHILKR